MSVYYFKEKVVVIVSKRVFGSAAAVVLSLGLLSCGSDPAPPAVSDDDSAVVDESVEASEAFVSDCAPGGEGAKLEGSGIGVGSLVVDENGEYCSVRLTEDNALFSLDLKDVDGYEEVIAAGYSEDELREAVLSTADFLLEVAFDSAALDSGSDVTDVWSGLLADGVLDPENIGDDMTGQFIVHGMPLTVRDGGPRVVSFSASPHGFSIIQSDYLSVGMNGYVHYRYGENYSAFYDWAAANDIPLTEPSSDLPGTIVGGTVSVPFGYVLTYSKEGLISGYQYKLGY